MKISCCMLTTNLNDRRSLVENTMVSLNKCEDIFDEKLMSINVFNDGFDLSWFDRYKEDWSRHRKDKDSHRSMILNQQNVVEKANNDVIFYTEDDIVINKIPQKDTIDKLFNQTLIKEKPVGFVSYNNHVWINFNENPKHIIDFINNIDNYVTINGDVFLVKNETIKDRYYLNFPVSIFRKDVHLALHRYAMNHSRGMTIEAGLTNAWFRLGYDKKYEVLIYLKNDILDDIKAGKEISVLDFYNYANMNFWNNDTSLRHQSVAGRNNNVVF